MQKLSNENLKQNDGLVKCFLLEEYRPYLKNTSAEIDEESKTIKIHVEFKEILCPHCHKPCSIHQIHNKEVQIKADDIGDFKVYFCYKNIRVRCKEHGVCSCFKPWVLNLRSKYTDKYALKLLSLSLNSNVDYIRRTHNVSWKYVDSLIDHPFITNLLLQPLNNVRAICIDETSYKRGHSYITVITDLDTGHIIYIAKGHDYKCLEEFFNFAGKDFCNKLEVILGDNAHWISKAAEVFALQAQRAQDRFHLVKSILDKLNNEIISLRKSYKKTYP